MVEKRKEKKKKRRKENKTDVWCLNIVANL